MTKTDIAWLAGFLDGEGSFMVTREMISTGPVYSAIVTAANTDRRLVDRCRELAGGYIVNVKAANPRHKNSYMWRVRGKAVGPLIEKLLPHLVGKVAQATLLLELRNITTVGASPGTYGRKFSQKDRDRRAGIRDAVQKLNHRGVSIPVNSGDPSSLSER